MEAKEIKEKILDFLKRRGPSLPVHVAKTISLDTLFTGAFLSELYKDRELKISHIKVGSSPLYFIPGDEEKLEEFIPYLEAKEKEACLLLKARGFLEDTKQLPAIRVALRAIKDFAIPIKKEDEIIWKYFTIKELPEEFEKEKKMQTFLKKPLEKPKPEKMEEIGEKGTVLEKPFIIQPETQATQEVLVINRQEERRRKKQEIQERFLNEVKEFLKKREILLIDIEEFNKKEVVAKIKAKGELYALIAYDKKRPDETDLIKGYRKALALDLPFYVLAKGDLSKKIKETVGAYKKMAGFGKIEQFPNSLEQQSF